MPQTRPLTIRRFRAADLPAVVAIESASFGADAWPEGEFRYYADRCGMLFLVAVAGGRVAGYSITCMLRVNAEVASVAVDPRHREKGVGRALLTRAMKRAAAMGARSIWLMVRRDNGAAIHLYQELGFKRRAIVRDYYEDGADGCRMEARL